jgi:uncharacterized protein YcaQ
VVLELSQAEARRVAVKAQLLTQARPADLFDVVEHLTMLQVSPTDAVAPSADLVLWSRLGSGYFRPELETALESRQFFEISLVIRPADDVPLYRAEMDDFREGRDLSPWQQGFRNWVKANDACRIDLLERFDIDGPQTARELPDTCVKPWKSSGWNDNRNVMRMLEILERMGEVAVAGRKGRDRLWDRAERVYPDVPTPRSDDARRCRDVNRLRSLGIARATGPDCQVEPQAVAEVGGPAVIEGVKGTWRVEPDYLDGAFEGRAALLSPLDRLVFDRARMEDIFDFDYQLEMYKPAAKRKWGYFALPILYGDELVGKVDATSDRKAGVFRVAAIHQDIDFTKQMESEIIAEIEDLADWLELEAELPR